MQLTLKLTLLTMVLTAWTTTVQAEYKKTMDPNGLTKLGRLSCNRWNHPKLSHLQRQSRVWSRPITLHKTGKMGASAQEVEVRQRLL